jgi:uncharacterized membrane protein
MSTSEPHVRRSYIDWARGIAVLLMVGAHTSDAWTRLADKHTHRFAIVSLLGGFAAPLFLWLAGVGVALSADRISQRQNRWTAVDTVCRRGLEIFILAFLFRLQAFLISPGSHPVTLFRVDILNVMGPAIFFAGLLWAVSLSTTMRALSYAVAATAITLVTPLVRTWSVVDALPIWLQWYVRPAGDYTTFTAFPWAGFVFAGTVCGTLLAVARERRDETRLQAMLGVSGALLTWLGFYTSARPSLYAQSSFWTSSPTWFAIRVGVMMMALALIYAVSVLCAHYGVTARWLERFGRSSLFVYWIHVELVYGYASWLWRGRLPLWASGLAFLVFLGLIYRAIVWRDRVAERWRMRPPRASGTAHPGNPGRYWSFDLSKNS